MNTSVVERTIHVSNVKLLLKGNAGMECSSERYSLSYGSINNMSLAVVDSNFVLHTSTFTTLSTVLKTML